MSVRTTHERVAAILSVGGDGGDYDGVSDLTPFIEIASALTDQLVTNASEYDGVTLGTSLLEIIERWLAAHFYVQSDQNLSSKTTNGASGQYQGQVGKGLEGSKYGISAMKADYTGNLDALDKRRYASTEWLGKVPSEQIDYTDRD